jgi:hypothetical protein
VRDEVRLHDQLFAKDGGYHSHIIPVFNTTQPVVVKIRLTVDSIVEVNEIEKTLLVQGTVALVSLKAVTDLHVASATRRVTTAFSQAIVSEDAVVTHRVIALGVTGLTKDTEAKLYQTRASGEMCARNMCVRCARYHAFATRSVARDKCTPSTQDCMALPNL